MSGTGNCADSPRASSLASSATRFLIVVDGDMPSIIERLEELGTVTRPYTALPILELESDPEVAAGLNGQPGVIAAVPALGGMVSSRTLAFGFDFLTVVSKALNHQAAGWHYGGRQQGDPGGYPVLVEGDTGWQVDLDEDKDWPAPMALVPVVSFSVGPRSAAYPCLSNDLVRIATLLASPEVLVVAAAGNCGGLGEGTVSAWAQSPWVLAVGATTDVEGTTLAPYSSRGVRGETGSGPDVVAHGQSVIAPHPEGTSFAAPRVAHLARLVTAAMCQLGREIRLARGAEPHGVPLVGLGMIDVFGDQLMHFPSELLPAQALPILGVDTDSVKEAMTRAKEANLEVDVALSPGFLRDFLLGCATEMPGYAPHEVGRGFIDVQGVRARLAELTFLDIVRWFSPSTHEGDIADQFATHRVFIEKEVDLLERVLRSTGPHVRYDYKTREVAFLPGTEDI